MTHSMTCEQFEGMVARLVEDEREMTDAMRSHLDGCDACRSLLADLRAIEAGARALPTLEPERDLWAGIEARIQAPVVSMIDGPGGRRQLSWRSAGIAAAALIAVTSMLTYQITRSDSTPVAPTAQPPVATTGAPTAAALPAAQRPTVIPTAPKSVALVSNSSPADYDREVARLRAIVDSGRTRLDPATVALLERNLSVIDSAIVQCRDALQRDPASQFLIESLKDSYQTKVKLLKMAARAAAG